MYVCMAVLFYYILCVSVTDYFSLTMNLNILHEHCTSDDPSPGVQLPLVQFSVDLKQD